MNLLSCAKCKNTKPETEFIKDKHAPRGYKSYCKQCQSIRVIQKKISGFSTPQENKNYLVWLITNGYTIKQCEVFFKTSYQNIFNVLKSFGFVNETDSKWCSTCKLFKNISDFCDDKNNLRFGKSCRCRTCVHENKKSEQYINLKNKYNERNRTIEEYILKKKVARDLDRARHPNRSKNSSSVYYHNHKAEQNARVLARKIRKMKATPIWADINEIKQVYVESANITKTTGIIHEVDHIHPLRSNLVCGLHVKENLQIIPRKQNRSKSNNFRSHIIDQDGNITYL